MPIDTINPATGELIQSYPTMSNQQIESIIDDCDIAFQEWRSLSFDERAKYMLKLAEKLKNQKHDLAKLITTEMGKPIEQSISEIEKCALTCEHYAKQAAEYLKPKSIKTEMSESFVSYQPLGVIFAIMPWNFPFWQVFRFAAPTLMAGNTAILKHAAISTGAALAIEQLFKEANFPEHCFRSIIIKDKDANFVIENPKIKAVTLTGSTRAGKAVGTIAAGVNKSIVLELGGSDPYLILEDADLEIAVAACVTSRMINTGQSCIAAKRFITVGKTHEPFVKLVLQKLKDYKNMGPLARKDLRDALHQQVQKSVELGAKLLVGGEVSNEKGFYYPPTILTNVKKGMPAYDEELFGPVFAIIHAETEEEAIFIANDTIYGLGAAVFSKDIERAKKIAIEKINSGTCVVNTFVASDPRLPFGGINQSGHGRELSFEGITSFVNVKTINVL